MTWQIIGPAVGGEFSDLNPVHLAKRYHLLLAGVKRKPAGGGRFRA